MLNVQDFEYSSSGQLSRSQLSSDGSSRFRGFRDFIYNGNGCLTDEVDGQTGSGGNITELNRKTNQYNGAGNTISGSRWDQGDDGSVEVVLTLETESEPYILPVIPGVFPDPRFFAQGIYCSQ